MSDNELVVSGFLLLALWNMVNWARTTSSRDRIDSLADHLGGTVERNYRDVFVFKPRVDKIASLGHACGFTWKEQQSFRVPPQWERLTPAKKGARRAK